MFEYNINQIIYVRNNILCNINIYLHNIIYLHILIIDVNDYKNITK